MRYVLVALFFSFVGISQGQIFKSKNKTEKVQDSAEDYIYKYEKTPTSRDFEPVILPDSVPSEKNQEFYTTDTDKEDSMEEFFQEQEQPSEFDYSQDTQNEKVFNPNPTRAGVYSALLPGLGQLYNKKYWKIPVAVGLVGLGVAYLSSQNNEYDRYRDAYLAELDGLNHEFSDTGISLERLADKQQDLKRDLNYAILLSSLAYILNILDAVVDAHLFELDTDEDISLSPSVIRSFGDNHLALNLQIKL